MGTPTVEVLAQPDVSRPRPATGGSPAQVFADRIRRIGFWLALSATLAQTVSHAVFVVALDANVDWNQLNAGVDTHAWAWASGSATFGVALLVALMALVAPRVRATWILLSLAVAYLSLDDVVALHEDIGLGLAASLDRPEHWARPLWVAVFAPLLGAVFAGLVSVSRTASERDRWAVRAGLALLVAALVLEVGTAAFVTGIPAETSLPYAAEVALEEAAELAGWILIATGLAATLGQRLAVPRSSLV